MEMRIFIHYRRGFGKPEGTPGVGPSPEDEDHSKHYKLLGKGVKWRELPVTYYIDPDNEWGLEEAFICEAIYTAAEEWDDGEYSQLVDETGWLGLEVELFNDSYVVIHDGSFDTDSPMGGMSSSLGIILRRGS